MRGLAVLSVSVLAACLSMPPRPDEDPRVDAPGSGSGFDARPLVDAPMGNVDAPMGNVDATVTGLPAELAALAATAVLSVGRY